MKKNIDDRTARLEQPHNTDAEQQVLGSILKNHELMDTVFEVIFKPLCFYVPKHQVIYRAIMKLYEKNEAIDITTVADVLQKHKRLDKIGGRLYLVELVEGIATTANIENHTKIVIETYKVRAAITGFTKLVNQAYSREVDSKEIVEGAESVMQGFSGRPETNIRPVGELVFDQAEHLLREKKAPKNYLTTRIERLNKKIIGIFQSQYTIIASDASMGKTSLALDIALLNTSAGKIGIYFPIDDDQDSTTRRIISSATGFQKHQYFYRNFTEADQEKLKDVGLKMLENDKLFICESPGLTVLDIKAIASAWKRKHGLHFIVVDYLQLLRPHRSFKAVHEQIAEQSMILKVLCKELDIAVIALSHITEYTKTLSIDPRKNQFGIPRLGDIRGSQQLKQDANLVLIPWRPLNAMMQRGFSEADEKFVYEKAQGSEGVQRSFISVAKQKDGPIGLVPCFFDERRMFFYTQIEEDMIPSGEEDTPF